MTPSRWLTPVSRSYVVGELSLRHDAPGAGRVRDLVDRAVGRVGGDCACCPSRSGRSASCSGISYHGNGLRGGESNDW